MAEAAHKTALDDAYELLKSRKYSVKEVYRVYSPGDWGGDCDKILYVTETGRPRSAFAWLEYDEDKDVYQVNVRAEAGW